MYATIQASFREMFKMPDEIEKKWFEYRLFLQRKLYNGLKNGYITLYDDELIKKLRNIYFEGVPASVILLCKRLSDKLCLNMSHLMASAFLDDEEEVKLLHITVDALRLNAELISLNIPAYAEHFVIQRTTKNGTFIYDTSTGYIYNKDLYWEMQNPEVIKVIGKEEILNYLNSNKRFQKGLAEEDLSKAKQIISIIEMDYNYLEEKYSRPGIELLQREIKHFKEQYSDMDYEDIDPFTFLL